MHVCHHRRIDWSLPPGKSRGKGIPGAGAEEEQEEEDEDVEPATCDLVCAVLYPKKQATSGKFESACIGYGTVAHITDVRELLEVVHPLC